MDGEAGGEGAGAVFVHRVAGQRDGGDGFEAGLQEIFLSLAANTTFEHRRGTTAWFYTTTTHYCLNRLRDDKNRARLRIERGGQEITSVAAGGEARVIARDLLARLPQELAEVAIYYYCDEMTHEEIAGLLGCSRRHVGHLVERLHLNTAVAEAG